MRGWRWLRCCVPDGGGGEDDDTDDNGDDDADDDDDDDDAGDLRSGDDFLCAVLPKRTLLKAQVNVLALPEISATGRGRLLEAGADNVVTIEASPFKRYQAFAKNYAIIRANSPDASTKVWQLSELLGSHYDKAAPRLASSPGVGDAAELSAAAAQAGHIQDFNAGLMVFSPQEATFQRLLELAPLVGSASGGVQPLLNPEKSWRSGLPTQERKITGGEPKAELKMRKLKNVARLAGNAELLVKAIQQDPLLKQLAINSPVVAHVIGSLHALKKMFSQEVLSKLRSGQVPEDASAQAVPDLAFTKRRVIGPQPEDPTLVSLKVGRSRQRQQPGISSGPRSENSEILLERELRLLDYIYADLLGSFWQTLLTLEAAQLVMAI
ncbi:hypothetical protein AK812_SmicGene9167 [Symbiodinium microadriaticum]|uniref:Uncharacterized protein n=1 Tax=Symbiodinium microadriaticum TaxID=2951 RepID=A0A1Q9EJ09_SYMMI|nr:hypothetical protein AK812_SmicGene9167 [Symbiodinium microadriaticum]